MRKIAIITLNDNKNFGNRLQNYALVSFLNKKGYDCYNLWKKDMVQSIKDFIKHFIPNKQYKRYRNFCKFSNQIKTKYVRNYSNDIFDYYIVGSDQVWNPNYANLDDFLLTFTQDDYKKISYAASIGLPSLDKKYEDVFKKNLYKFKAISVREQQGKKIVDNLLNSNRSTVLIDPTMLLDSNEWELVMKKPKKEVPKKYVFLYFLGNLSTERIKHVKKFAKNNNCDIINILDKNDPFYTCGPSEFLYLEKHAFLICTDSFHSCVFSILFNKPFVIFDRDEKNRDNMGSRIDTLLDTFKIENRKYNNKEITKKNLLHNYSKAYEILKKEREKSLHFFTENIK